MLARNRLPEYFAILTKQLFMWDAQFCGTLLGHSLRVGGYYNFNFVLN